ncbi:hypothetical protein [Amphritea sp.]|uniref:hypothetical protein n=1 Tax=Amphritea sp. TaxID=1872502 RepID=UPI003D0E517C
MNIKLLKHLIAITLAGISCGSLADQSTTFVTKDGGHTTITSNSDGHVIERTTPTSSTTVESTGTQGRSHADMIREEKENLDGTGGITTGGPCPENSTKCSGQYLIQ